MHGIRPETQHLDRRNAFGTVLEAWFDGDWHTFGGERTFFPDCDIVFERPQFGAEMTKPTIYVMEGAATTTRRWATKTGIRKTTDRTYRFFVYTPYAKLEIRSGVFRGGRALNDEVQDALELVLNGVPQEFAQYGIRITGVAESAEIPMSADQAMLVSMRDVGTKMTLEYGQPGTGAASSELTGSIT